MLKVGYFLYGIHMQGYLSSRTSTCTCNPNDNIKKGFQKMKYCTISNYGVLNMYS